MKINVICGDCEQLSGYTEFHPSDDFLLDSICEDGEADCILVADCVDYIPPGKADAAFDNWVKKVSKGGTLIIGGTDAFEVSKAFSNYAITLDEFNKLIHGMSGEKHATYSCSAMCEFLKGMGYKLIKKRINNLRYTIEAVRQ